MLGAYGSRTIVSFLRSISRRWLEFCAGEPAAVRTIAAKTVKTGVDLCIEKLLMRHERKETRPAVECKPIHLAVPSETGGGAFRAADTHLAGTIR
jgi:hypothetical protein